MQALHMLLLQLKKAVDTRNSQHVIELCRNALSLIKRNEQKKLWAELQYFLAKALAETTSLNRAENLDLTITHYQQALTVYTQEQSPTEWARTHTNLGRAYIDRTRGPADENIEYAIQHCADALRVWTPEKFPEEWAGVHNNLADAYVQRIQGTPDENMELAIFHAQQALRIWTRERFSHYRGLALNNLGNAYIRRVRGTRRENVELAILHYQDARSVYKEPSFESAMVLNNLAHAYSERLAGDRAENLERAIAHYEKALSIFTISSFPQRYALAHNNVAGVYLNRVEGARADNIESAIEHCKHALRVYTYTDYPGQWGDVHSNLALCYLERIYGDREENLEIAIEHAAQTENVFSLETSPQQWAMIQNILGLTYSERIRGDRSGNLQRAIQCFQSVKQVWTRQQVAEDWAGAYNNLGRAYANLWLLESQSEHHEQAVRCYQQALEVFTIEQFPSRCRMTMSSLANLFFAAKRWGDAASHYKEAAKAGDVLLAEAYTEIGRRGEVTETGQLYARLAYCQLRLGQPAAALDWLEKGKARLLAEALALQEADIHKLPETDKHAVRDAREQVRRLEAEMRQPFDTPARRSNRAIAENLQSSRRSLKTILEQVRTQYPDFLPTGLDLSRLFQCIPVHGALVVPVVTAHGSAVFILPYGTTAVTDDHVLWLEGCSDSTLESVLYREPRDTLRPGWLDAYAHRHTDETHWQHTIEETGQYLWEVLVGPIYERLQQLGVMREASIVFMPPGGFAILPLHAAWREVNGAKRPFLEDYTISFAPSGYALDISARRLQEPCRQMQSLGAILNPTDDLVFAAVEGKMITARFPSSTCASLVGGHASKEGTIKTITGKTYVHFSCHGFYDGKNVMNSGLRLAGNVALTMAEIIARVDLSATRLVTLSACDTGIIDIRYSPDEFLGLPAAILQAGAPAVVSTLWAVGDLSTALLMEQFYLLHRQGLTPTAALRKAQLWLRDVTAGDLADRFRAAKVQSDSQQLLSYEETSQAWRQFVGLSRSTRPFVHPFYWAAFTLSGM